MQTTDNPALQRITSLLFRRLHLLQDLHCGDRYFVRHETTNNTSMPGESADMLVSYPFIGSPMLRQLRDQVVSRLHRDIGIVSLL